MAKRSPARINTFSFGFRGGQGTQNRMEVADQHNEIELNLVEQGELVFQHGAGSRIVTAGDTIIFWAAIPHQVLLARPGTKVAWLSLPLSWFLSWNLPSPLGRRILQGEMLKVTDEARLGVAPFRLRQWAVDLEMKSPELEKIVELDLEAYFRRLALHFDRLKSPRLRSRDAGALSKNRYRPVQQMVKFMTENFRDPLSVARIAAAARLNPEYAMRLFRKCWGMTLWEFLLRQRISEAQRLLVLGDDKVADIALATGFGSLGRFYAAFKRQCRCTPNAYRRRQRETRFRSGEKDGFSVLSRPADG